MKLDHFLISYTKIHSEWIKDLTVGPKTIQIIAEGTGSNFSDTGHNNIFLAMSPERRKTKGKNKNKNKNKKTIGNISK